MQPRLSPVARPALPPHLIVEYLEQTRGAIDFNRPGIPFVASLPSVHIADTYGKSHQRQAGHRRRRSPSGHEQHDVPLVDLKAAVGDQVMSGHGNPDGIHWNFEAHQAVAELMLKGLAEAGVTQEDPALTWRVVVVTDSSSRLEPEELERCGIRQVPLHVLVDGNDLRDGVDEVPDDVHERHATTAGATPAELADAYREALADSGGDGVVAVHLSAASVQHLQFGGVDGTRVRPLGSRGQLADPRRWESDSSHWLPRAGRVWRGPRRRRDRGAFGGAARPRIHRRASARQPSAQRPDRQRPRRGWVPRCR